MATSTFPTTGAAAAAEAGPIRAADGTPLKRKLAQALFVSRLRAFLLVAPLLLFLLLAFVGPIFALLLTSFQDPEFADLMPETTEALRTWDGVSEPPEGAFAALVADLKANRENKTIGQVATRVNREAPGSRSLFTGSARKVKNVDGPDWRASFLEEVGERNAAKWEDPKVWQAMKVASQRYTPAYYAAALDYRYTAQGSFEPQSEERQIHVMLFLRTVGVAAAVTILCLVVGYPVAYLLGTLPLRTSNLLLILVLLPFWTSLLVRTTSWIALLQGEGVINDTLVALGVVSDDGRLSMIYNMTGTLVAMTHILLPFMILPLYSVMRTIAPSYVRAAKSLGASNWTAFWRVYAPLTLPGVGAGALLVFILSIGYYITPALVGGEDGTLISNFIAFHMQKSLNWSLAAALGALLLAGVLALYWLYDRLIGIDNMKLG